MELSIIPSRSLYLKWVSATAVGLVLGIVLYFFLPRPAYAPGSSIVSIISFIFKWLHILVGISIGLAQGLVIQKHTRGLVTWVIATTLGWNLAIRIGTDVFDTFFNTIINHTMIQFGTALSMTELLISAELLSGIVVGFIMGLAQWVALGTTLVKFWKWMMVSVLAWGAGFLVEGLAVISITSSKPNVSEPYFALEPLVLGFENVLIGHSIPRAQSSIGLQNEVVPVVIALIVGSVIGGITGAALFLKWSAFLKITVANWQSQNLITRLCSGLGATVVVVCLALALFLVTKEFDALALMGEGSGFDIPVTAGGCMPKLELQPEKRVVKENESIPIYARLHNSQESDCPVVIKLYTTDFDFVPAEPSQAVAIPPQQTATLVWMITPKRLGTYSIGISSGIDSRTAAVSVVNMFGLTAQQAKILSLVGTFFGPALTFPWLFSLWQERRVNAQKQTAEVQINDLRREIEDLKRKKRVKRN